MGRFATECLESMFDSWLREDLAVKIPEGKVSSSREALCVLRAQGVELEGPATRSAQNARQ